MSGLNKEQLEAEIGRAAAALEASMKAKGVPCVVIVIIAHEGPHGNTLTNLASNLPRPELVKEFLAIMTQDSDNAGSYRVEIPPP